MAESEAKEEAEAPAADPIASEPNNEEPPPPAPPPQEPPPQEPPPQEHLPQEPPPQEPPPQEPPPQAPPPPPPPEVKKPEAASQPNQRTSIEAKRATSVDQETFTPPPLRKSMPRSSLAGAARRMSGSERNLTISRKSRFGALGSKARMVLGSIVDIKSNAAELLEKKVARYQNTYKLGSDNPFNSQKVDKILREVMDETLENLHYDPEKCASSAKAASVQIRNKVKLLDFERYKLVCVVSIGEKNSQDIYATCRFLWDPERDRYSFYSLENTYVYAIAYCFGLYYE